MQATVTIEVPPGTDVIVYLKFIDRAGPQRKEPPPVHLVLVPPPEPAPVSPRGPQLWLSYNGWECDAIPGCGKLDFREVQR
jgi:hypothetical protein